MADLSFIGKGKLYAQPYDRSGPAMFLRNCSVLELSHAFEEKSQLDFTSAGGGEANALKRLNSVTAAITMLEYAPENLSLGTLGTLTAQTGVTAIVDELHADVRKGTTGGFVMTNRLMNTSIAPVVKVGAATKTAGTDYIAGSAAGIFIPVGSTIIDLDDVLISYTPVASDRIESLTVSPGDYEMVLDGLNEANSGKAVRVVIRRAKISAAEQISLIGDDFATLPLSFKCLSDSAVVAAGVSKFYYWDLAR